jgi:transposase
MKKKIDAHDGDFWTDMDIRDLMAALRCGSSIEEVAQRLCRSGTVDEVRRKAEELGLSYKSQTTKNRK